MTDSKELWLQAGYNAFALNGIHGLKIEQLAAKTGISKSSFYHHFADVEIFTEILMDYHLTRAEMISLKEKQAKTIDPDLIIILVEYKMDLLFNRQLRFNRDNKLFNSTFTKTNRLINETFLGIWINELKINMPKSHIENIYNLALENFYLQISEKNLSYNWLSEYFDNLKHTAIGLSGR